MSYRACRDVDTGDVANTTARHMTAKYKMDRYPNKTDFRPGKFARSPSP
jgi:hypothetical protein